MNYKQFFLEELDREMTSTRKTLERVSMDKADWKPHDKSTSLIRLATHIASLHGFLTTIVNTENFDMAGWKADPDPKTTEELVSMFDNSFKTAREALEKMPDEDFEKTWSFLFGETVILSDKKGPVIQSFVINHLVHHRAQLGVYLRLLDIAIPAVYGPSADEQ